MFKCSNDKMLKWRGFTLAEIMVSIFIIMLLAGIIFTNYRQGGQQFALQRSANKLVQDLRSVEQMAMSAKEYNGVSPKGGYGIYFDNSAAGDKLHYILFADCNGNYKYDASGTAPDCASATQINPYPEKIGDTIGFEKGVSVDFPGVFYSEPGGPLTPPLTGELSITFTPIEPKVMVNSISNNTAWIALKSESLGTIKVISVNPNGLIEVSLKEVVPGCNCEYKEYCAPGGVCGLLCCCQDLWRCIPLGCQPDPGTSPCPPPSCCCYGC